VDGQGQRTALSLPLYGSGPLANIRRLKGYKRIREETQRKWNL
jgi:hypothetical protein